ncbi:hypothetical protein [Neptunomonas antarctica]|uniref:Uracil-DNA glycosylase, family 4 n=1 Tax=Neptunomonas antarctica TaxID=619304 RepID=A0A1N7J8J1_9GAMM|nr:hypothetical protein [Neptunomonas antarctica]SIS45614.1 uracil-DNA glycosylase, family 4 [Neptunomonas antarctica]
MHSNHFKQEQRRHQYLAAMGVTSWLPRAALVGARSSPEAVYQFLYGHENDVFESDEAIVGSAILGEPAVGQAVVYEGADDAAAIADAEHAGEDTVRGVTSSIARASHSTSPGPSHSVSHNSSHATREAAPVTAASLALNTPSAVISESPTRAADLPKVRIEPRVSKELAPRFRLGFWLYNDVLIIDSLPPQSRGGITAEKYKALCANIMSAMGLRADLLASPYVLAWPMLAGAALDQGKSEAALAVNHKIHKLFQIATPRLILFLGESAAQMAMQREEGIDELRAVVFSYSSEIKAVTSLSLTQMIQIPGCKKEVWSDLQKVLPLDA